MQVPVMVVFIVLIIIMMIKEVIKTVTGVDRAVRYLPLTYIKAYSCLWVVGGLLGTRYPVFPPMNE